MTGISQAATNHDEKVTWKKKKKQKQLDYIRF